MDVLDEFTAFVGKLHADEKAELDTLIGPELKALWQPEPTNQPQVDAYCSKADLLLYGGSAGSGKSDLVIGTALTAHTRSVIFRRQNTDLGDIEERIIQLAGRDGWNGADKVLRRGNKLLELGHLEKPGSEMTWQGGLGHDFIGFDEGSQLQKPKVQFVLGWLRSTEPGQRCRCIIATNPPMSADGEWIIEWFAPWLDPLYPDPAKPGELRWAATAPTKDGATVWLPDGDPIVFEDEAAWRKATPDEVASAKAGGGLEVTEPKTRTFIPGKLKDNKYLANTGYRAQLQTMPEPWRSKVLNGDFMAGREDHEWQVIPTAWIEAAQNRWTPQVPRCGMTAMGVDIAQGGADQTILAPRYGGWYAPLTKAPGKTTQEGKDVAAMVVRERRNNCPVIIDAGGGWGTEAASVLGQNSIPVVAYLGQRPSLSKAKGSNIGFYNKRAESWWRMREELDPNQEGGSCIALPPGQSIKADLSSAHYDLDTTRGYRIEDKAEIKKRLGRSPDEGDAIVLALSEGSRAAARQAMQSRRDARPTRANVGYAHLKNRGIR